MKLHWLHLDFSGNGSVKLGNRGILFNNEKHETTRKNFMEAALTASMRRTSHAIFSGHFVSFVVKKYHCHPVTDALLLKNLLGKQFFRLRLKNCCGVLYFFLSNRGVLVFIVTGAEITPV